MLLGNNFARLRLEPFSEFAAPRAVFARFSRPGGLWNGISMSRSCLDGIDDAEGSVKHQAGMSIFSIGALIVAEKLDSIRVLFSIIYSRCTI